MSSKPQVSLLRQISHFGRIVGSPPGLPGGGITGVLPVLGVGNRMAGSTPVGGHSTPSDFASLSASGSLCLSAGFPNGAMSPLEVDWVGAQLVGPGAGAAVADEGGAVAVCAAAMPDAVSSNHKRGKRECFILMQGNYQAKGMFPPKRSAFKVCGSGSVKNAPWAALAVARSG